MSLESINTKFRNAEKTISLTRLTAYCTLLGITTVGFTLIANPSYLEYYPNISAQMFVLSIFVMAFMAMYLGIVGGAVAAGITITWFLIICRDRFYQKNGVVIGKSLSTNDSFLSNLARGLVPKIIGLIRGYNDPRFEELEVKITKTNEENEQLRTRIDLQDKVIARYGLAIFFANLKIKKQQKEIETLKKINEESNTIVADKIQGNNKIED